MQERAKLKAALNFAFPLTVTQLLGLPGALVNKPKLRKFAAGGRRGAGWLLEAPGGNTVITSRESELVADSGSQLALPYG